MRRRKLRYRILLHVLPVMVLTLAAGAVLSDQAAEEELAVQAQRQLASVAKSVVQALSFSVAKLRQDTHFVSQTPELQNYLAYREFDMPREAAATLASFRRFLADFARNAPDYLQLRYLDPSGQELVRVFRQRLQPPRHTPDPALLDRFRPTGPYQTRDLSRVQMLGVRRLPDHGSLVLTAARKVHGSFHRPGRYSDFVAWGLVVLDYDWELLLKFFTSLRGAQVIIVDQQGRLLAHPDRARILERAADLPSLPGGPKAPPGRLYSWVQQEGGTHYQTVATRFAPGPEQSWLVMVRAPLAQVMRPARQVRLIIVVVTLVCVAAAVAGILWTSGVVTRPIQRLVEATSRIAAGDLSVHAPVPHTTEVAALAEAFNQMVVDLQKHIEELKRTTAEKERLASELAIAARLQRSVLPSAPPRLPPGWDLAGITLPARETGGDFFDYLELPQGRLGIVVADVAGKGLPAALFMLSARAMLRTLALTGHDPVQIVSGANRLLAADSGDSGMFVTVFYLELDPARGTLRYVNAGHNPPLLVRGGRVVELAPTGMALGALAEAEFQMRREILAPGERLVLYTDGVTEAPDAQGRQFGEVRLRSLVLAGGELPAGELVERIRREVFSHTGDQPQFDDVTLVALMHNSQAHPSLELELPAVLSSLEEFARFMAQAAQKLDLPPEVARALELCGDEALTNVIEYAYPPDQPGPVRLRLERGPEEVRLVIEDQGKPFTPEQAPPPDLDSPLEERRVGGLGIYFMHQMMDRVEHSREGGTNRLVLGKRLKE